MMPLSLLGTGRGDLESLHVWEFFITDDPMDRSQLLKENLLIWSVLYLPIQFLLYSTFTRHWFKSFKLNPKYPSPVMMTKELIRSLRGVYICSFYEYMVYQVPLRYKLPILDSLPSAGNGLTIMYVGIGGVILYLWGDCHFYFTHRILHSSWLYKNVHKYHHESYNPTPFSGLSMHWFESMIYFSAAPLLALAGAPMWLFRLMSKGLLIFPLEGHTGYGARNVESSCNHYIHHAKFDYNYGSSPIWDRLLGTNYSMLKQKSIPDMTDAEKCRYESALKQGRLVGCSIEVSE